MTLMAVRAFLYSVVRCPSLVTDRHGREFECNRRLMDVPGDPMIETRTVEVDHASGTGRVIRCERCGKYVEVTET